MSKTCNWILIGGHVSVTSMCFFSLSHRGRFPPAVCWSGFAKWGRVTIGGSRWHTLSPYLVIFMVHLFLLLVQSSSKSSRVIDMTRALEKVSSWCFLLQTQVRVIASPLVSALFFCLWRDSKWVFLSQKHFNVLHEGILLYVYMCFAAVKINK